MNILPTQLIQLPLEKLTGRGNKEVAKLLLPLVKKRLWQKVPTSSNTSTFAFAMSDSSSSGVNVADFFFRTSYPGIQAQYYEVWKKNPDVQINLYYLEKAYLHIYKVEQQGRKEFVLLHCDPSFGPDESLKIKAPDSYNKMKRQVPYKRLPHIHIEEAKHPFPKAHLAMNFGYNEIVLESLDSLFTAMKFGIQMLKEEILDAI